MIFPIRHLLVRINFLQRLNKLPTFYMFENYYVEVDFP